MSGDVVVRELTEDEMPGAWELGRLAFGGESGPVPYWATQATPGVIRYGAFDRSGRLLGKANDLHHEQWWDGGLIPAADVGGVAVAPEARGRGVARALLRRLLEGARDRGAVVSALYPTVSAVYRSAGWAMVGELRTLDVPAAFLPRHPPAGVSGHSPAGVSGHSPAGVSGHSPAGVSGHSPAGVSGHSPAGVSGHSPAGVPGGSGGDGLIVRPGTIGDLAAAGRLYTEMARTRNGLLSRDGPLFPPPGDAFAGGIDGLTLVEEAGALVGFASWDRSSGTGPDAVLTVVDMVATTAAAARQLVGLLASWRTVTPTIRFRALPAGIVSRELPLEVARDQHVSRWMHRPVDVVKAVAGRRWAPSWRAAVTFGLRDDLAPWNTGTWRLEVADGRGRLEPSPGPAALRLHVEGFGLLYTGAASPAMLLEAGLLEAEPEGDPDALVPLMSAPSPELLDYF